MILTFEFFEVMANIYHGDFSKLKITILKKKFAKKKLL